MRSITGLDTLKASKLLKKFVVKGLLDMISIGNTKNTFYIRKDTENYNLLSLDQDKRLQNTIKPIQNKAKRT